MTPARAARLGVPALVAALTCLAVWWVWGSLRQLTIYHDEEAYVLQAAIFASGRWAAPAPPLPEFFEQYHVLVTPALAGRYPPGHALALAPGALFGYPGLVSVALSGLSGALLFVLVRGLAGGWAGVLAWLAWLTSFGNLFFRATYLSEVTTSALWLLAWWSLLRWRRSRSAAALAAVAACLAWGALTRPLTTAAFALPLAVVILRDLRRAGSWRSLLPAAALGALLLGVIPLWSHATTGSWTETPMQLYSRQYFPWERPGFTVDTSPGLRPLPRDMQVFAADFTPLLRDHTPAALPRIYAERLRWVGESVAGGWRWLLAPFALAGLYFCGAAGWVALACAASVFLAYGVIAGHAQWTVYYLESFPVVAGVAAVGLVRTLERVGLAGGTGAAGSALRGHLVPAALAAAMALLSLRDLGPVRETVREKQGAQRAFADLLAAIPGGRAGVFVRYSPAHLPHNAYVRNTPDPGQARVVVAHDRGEENRRLMALMPGRDWYLFDESRWTLFPL